MRPIRFGPTARAARRIVAVVLLGFAGAASAAGANHTIVIDGVKYSPASLTVRRGDRVTWVNKDPFPHTVTAKGAFDSKDIAAGAKWTYVARKPGMYGYVCTYHPNMKGLLKVE